MSGEKNVLGDQPVKDCVEIIATAIITTDSGLVVLGRMREDAPNKLAGEWHFPGTGVNVPPTGVVDALSLYLSRATGLNVELGQIKQTWIRIVPESDRTRSVIHVCYQGHISGDPNSVLYLAVPQVDLAEIRFVTKKEAFLLLQEGEAAWERCHPELLRLI